MSVPKYNDMMLPVLMRLGQEDDGVSLSSKQLRTFIVEHYKLGEEDISETIPSGMKRYANNMLWACTYLKQARLISSPKRGLYCITSRGRDLLSESPSQIDKNLLLRYEEFGSFVHRDKKRAALSGDSVSPCEKRENQADGTPEDLIKESFDEINAALASELLDAILQQTPAFFEKLVVDVLLAMGYGDSRADSGVVTKATGDEGIDGIVREDKLGFDNIFIQAKRWAIDRTVTRPELQAFVGALTGAGATKGLFITTARFSSGAREYAERQHATKLVLVDGGELARLMIAHGVGVSVKQRYELKGIDQDYFDVGE